MKRKTVIISAVILGMANLWGCGDGSFMEADFSGILEGLEDKAAEDENIGDKGKEGEGQEASEKKQDESEKAAENAEKIRALADRVAEAGKKGTEDGGMLEKPEQEGQAEGADTYIIPESDTEYIDKAFLENLTKEELRLARNEIFARHGRMFQDEELQRYFNSKSWYTASYTPDEFTKIHNEVLNDFEKANLEVIQEVEGD